MDNSLVFVGNVHSTILISRRVAIQGGFFSARGASIFRVFQVLRLILFNGVVSRCLYRTILRILSRGVFFYSYVTYFRISRIVIMNVQAIYATYVIFRACDVTRGIVLIMSSFVQ